MNKRSAIERVNSHGGGKLLTSSNACFSSINRANPVWWLTIPVSKFENELHLLLRKRDGGLIWIRIPASRFQSPENMFRYRPDKDAVSLEISCERQRYLSEVKGPGSVRFHPLVEQVFE